MTFLEQPWQARADRPGTATRLPWHRTADVRELDESTPRWYWPAFLVMLAAVCSRAERDQTVWGGRLINPRLA